MDVFERVQKEVPTAKALRMRNEHAQILDAAEIPRFKALDVIASIQPTHCTSDMPWVPARIGAERTAEGAYVWRKLIDARRAHRQRIRLPRRGTEPDARLLRGHHASGSSTASRREGWAPDQRLTREETLRSFTLGAAYAAHAEDADRLARARASWPTSSSCHTTS